MPTEVANRPVRCTQCGVLWINPLSRLLAQRMGGCLACGGSVRPLESRESASEPPGAAVAAD